MKTTTFVYNCISDNVGDLNSCPLDYFNFNFTKNIRVNIKEMRMPGRKKYYNDNMIFGGGGIISGRIKKMFRLLHDEKPKKCKIFAWGLGHNEATDKKTQYGRPSIQYFMPMFQLFGTRDYFQRKFHREKTAGDRYRYVPCVSCMNKVFDQRIEKPIHPIVIYDHVNHFIPDSSRLHLPRMTNDHVKIEDVIKFLSSGELVVTSAYHGAYWAMLLNRKVIMIPWASRFYGFERPVIKANFDDWQTYIDQAMSMSFDGYFTECRRNNIKYYKEVKRLMYK